MSQRRIPFLLKLSTLYTNCLGSRKPFIHGSIDHVLSSENEKRRE